MICTIKISSQNLKGFANLFLSRKLIHFLSYKILPRIFNIMMIKKATMETGPLLNLEKKNIVEPQKNKWPHKFAFLSHFEISCIKRDSELFLCVIIMVTCIC